MSRRNRRQEKQLIDLAGNAEDLDVRASDDEEEPGPSSQPDARASAFAALSMAGPTFDEEDIDNDQAEEAELDGLSKSKPKRKKKSKKQKKASADHQGDNDGEIENVSASEPTLFESSPSSKKGRKSKARQPDVHSQDGDDLDEIDMALKELGLRPGQASHSTTHTSHNIPLTSSSIRSLLAVDAKHLDAESELKRFFGAKVVASADVKPQVRGARALNPHHAVGRQFSRGGMLAKPQQNWPPGAFSKSGLSMDLVEASGGEALWTFEHSKSYVEVTQMYLEAVSSLDPNQLMALLHVHPYHVETLLGLSDMAAQQGDPGMSQDFLDRALFAFEKAFAPNFNTQNGNARLDFTRIESRGLFRALDKRISSLMRRGTWRTLHEHAKLLYALSPFDDPYGALLFLDFTAPKSKQYTWLLDFLQEMPSSLKLVHDNHLRIEGYPGLFYAKALCRWHHEEDSKQPHDQSNKDLQQAVLRYPLTCRILYEKIGFAVPSTIASLQHAQPDQGFSQKPSYLIQLLSHLYVLRSETLWKEPEVLEWLKKIVTATSSIFTSEPSNPDVAFGKNLWSQSLYSKAAVPEGILRHVLVSDIQSLRTFLPREVLNSVSLTFDPLPPGPGFDDNYFKALYDGNLKRRGGPAGSALISPPTQANSDSFLQRLAQFLRMNARGQNMDADTEAAVIAQLEQYASAARDEGMPGDFAEIQANDDEGGGPHAAAGVVDFFRSLWEGQQQQQPEHAGRDSEQNQNVEQE